MLVCRKPRVVFEARYTVKKVYHVAQIRVEPMMNTPKTKVGSESEQLNLMIPPPHLGLGIWTAYL